MTYKISFHPKVKKFFQKHQDDTAKRILNKLHTIKSNPFRYLDHYEGEKLYKLRIGDFRALIDVDNEKKILYVEVLDKRSRIYKK